MTRPCITCEFTRAEYQRLAAEHALLREVLRAVCGERADELLRLMKSRVRAAVDGASALVEELDRQFCTALTNTIAESAAPLVAHLDTEAS